MKASSENLRNGLGSERFDHQPNYPEGGAGGEQSQPVLPGKDDPAPRGVRRMWAAGPLRQFGERQAGGHYVAYSSPFLKGYAGSYVCDRCLRPCAGVYYLRELKNWLCGDCRKQAKRAANRVASDTRDSRRGGG
jgi:hypothetical protein